MLVLYEDRFASLPGEPWKAPTGDWIEHNFHKKDGERPAEWPAPLREQN